jgi:hypothetical protein
MRRKGPSIVAVVARVVAVTALVALMWVAIFVFPAKDHVVHLSFIARAVVGSLLALAAGFYAWATSLRAHHPIRRFAERLAKELTAIWRS